MVLEELVQLQQGNGVSAGPANERLDVNSGLACTRLIHVGKRRNRGQETKIIVQSLRWTLVQLTGEMLSQRFSHSCPSDMQILQDAGRQTRWRWQIGSNKLTQSIWFG